MGEYRSKTISYLAPLLNNPGITTLSPLVRITFDGPILDLDDSGPDWIEVVDGEEEKGEKSGFGDHFERNLYKMDCNSSYSGVANLNWCSIHALTCSLMS